MAQWAGTKEVNIASQQNLADEVQVSYFHALNPEE
jgi:hypothetical protein